MSLRSCGLHPERFISFPLCLETRDADVVEQTLVEIGKLRALAAACDTAHEPMSESQRQDRKRYWRKDQVGERRTVAAV